METLMYDSVTKEKTLVTTPDVETPDAEVDPEVMKYRREHLDAVKGLCQLAGALYTGKLENVRYRELSLDATSNPNNAAMLALVLSTLTYTCDVLRHLEGDQWWENMGDMR